jgi:hypothetical protein
MRGFKLDTAHDLSLDTGGRLEYLSGDDAVVQEISTRLKFLRGEAFTDLREGVPWYQEILRKGLDLARVRSIIRQTIASVPAVLDVPSVEIDLERETRTATIRWTARVASGRVIRSEDYPPLVV